MTPGWTCNRSYFALQAEYFASAGYRTFVRRHAQPWGERQAGGTVLDSHVRRRRCPRHS